MIYFSSLAALVLCLAPLRSAPLRSAPLGAVFNVDTGSTGKNRRVVLSNMKNELDENNVGVLLSIPKEEDLFPTLSLHSTMTSVMGNFSGDDIKPMSDKKEIGLFRSYREATTEPFTVYALDGSVVLSNATV